MPKAITYYLTQQEVDAMRLVSANKVLIQIVEKNEEKKTASGIILVSPTYRSIARPSMNPVDSTDMLLFQNADKHGVVVQVPTKLKRYKNHLWKTGVEIVRGDAVWFDAMIGENCDRIQTETNLYYLMDYFDLHLVKRGDEVVMLNGYCLFSLVDDKVDSKLAIDTGKKDARYGMLAYKGSCNTYYYGGLIDDASLQVGDKCIFAMPPVMLESAYHACFDGKNEYRISQRYNVMAYIRNGVLHATDNHVIVEAEKDTHKGMVEIPSNYRKPNGYGKVYDARYARHGIKHGDRIKYIPSAGLKIEFDGKEYYILKMDAVLVTFKEIVL